VDACVAELVRATVAARGVMIVTADHGNADQMIKNGKPLTSHTLNPVPFILVDPTGAWELSEVSAPGLANIGTSVLALCGLQPPDDFQPSLVRPAPQEA
jgi:2,3-bisphosphoglycerate-independent phosphoglycerate mutase